MRRGGNVGPAGPDEDRVSTELTRWRTTSRRRCSWSRGRGSGRPRAACRGAREPTRREELQRRAGDPPRGSRTRRGRCSSPASLPRPCGRSRSPRRNRGDRWRRRDRRGGPSRAELRGNRGAETGEEAVVGGGVHFALAVRAAIADLDADTEAAILAGEVGARGVQAERAEEVERGEVRSIAEHGHSSRGRVKRHRGFLPSALPIYPLAK